MSNFSEQDLLEKNRKIREYVYTCYIRIGKTAWDDKIKQGYKAAMFECLQCLQFKLFPSPWEPGEKPDSKPL